MVEGTVAANEFQRRHMVDKVVAAIGAPRGKRVAVLGLSFKPNTDDVREAPALTIIAGLKRRGVKVIGYDVVNEYHGQRYSTRTDRDPGPRLAIDVRPSGSPAYDDRAARSGTPVPPAGYGEPSYEQAPPANYPAPPSGYPMPPASYYGPVPAPVYAPAPAYYPAPAVYYRPRYYGPPLVSIGFSSGYGWRGHRHGY